MGNTVVWKPASTAAVSAHFLMKLFEEAGLPPGVINLVYGSGSAVGDPALANDNLAGIHFTGSTPVFQGMWKTVGENIARYRNYPRIVGETGGKDFIVAHPSADPEALATAILRGSFEYQGQKCSAASRVFAPASLWPQVRDQMRREIETMKMGDVADFANFVGAVIDASSFKTQKDGDRRSEGVRRRLDRRRRRIRRQRRLVRAADRDRDDRPEFRTMQEELFGPVVTAFVYDDSRYDERSTSSTPARATASPAPSSRATAPRSSRHETASATRPATSTSTTSRPEPSSGSSRSAARARRARTTRPARCGTSSAGSPRARSRRRSSHRATIATRSWDPTAERTPAPSRVREPR